MSATKPPLRKRTRLLIILIVAAVLSFFGKWSAEEFSTSSDIDWRPTEYSWLRETDITPTSLPSADPEFPIFTSISRGNLIPNRILRTWKTGSAAEIREMSLNGSDHPDRFRWFQTWSNMNPRAVQIVLADADMDPFVRGSFSRRVVDAFFKLPRMVLRADFLRYMMLYELGGVYTDMDTSCNVPIWKWNLGLNGVAVIVGVEDPGYHNDEKYGKGIDSIQQWTMASARHHPFMAKVINAVTDKIHSMTEKELLEADVLELTGPGIWKRVVYEHLHGMGADLEASANMWTGYKLYGDFLVVGKHYLNNDNGDNPKSFIRHHFTGFTSFGWRQSGNTLANETRKIFEQENNEKKKKVSLVSESDLDEVFNWRFTPLLETLSGTNTSVNASTSVTKVHRVIFQIAANTNSTTLSNALSKFEESQNTWRRLNNGYAVRHFSVTAMDRFVDRYCSLNERRAYYRLPVVKHRAALFKFLYLLKRGGIYADIDSDCRVPVRGWGLGKKVGLILGFKDQHHSPPSVQQAVMYARAGHPLLTKFVAMQVLDIVEMSQADLNALAFNDFWGGRFNEFLARAMEERGVDLGSGLARLSWSGHVEFDDVLIHGNERFSPSNRKNILAYVAPRGDIWNDVAMMVRGSIPKIL